MIIVSACLAGINCKYNGKNNYNKKIETLVKENKAIPACPEQLGGCSTPRIAAEIKNGTGKDVLAGKCKVIRKDGTDVTNQFIIGANEFLKLTEMLNADKAILKSMSPSCGYKKIYDGSFSGTKVDGNGVLAELLIQNGIEVLTEKDL